MLALSKLRMVWNKDRDIEPPVSIELNNNGLFAYISNAYTMQGVIPV